MNVLVPEVNCNGTVIVPTVLKLPVDAKDSASGAPPSQSALLSAGTLATAPGTGMPLGPLVTGGACRGSGAGGAGWSGKCGRPGMGLEWGRTERAVHAAFRPRRGLTRRWRAEDVVVDRQR
jgi:hypothetical protein